MRRFTLVKSFQQLFDCEPPTPLKRSEAAIGAGQSHHLKRSTSRGGAVPSDVSNGGDLQRLLTTLPTVL